MVADGSPTCVPQEGSTSFENLAFHVTSLASTSFHSLVEESGKPAAIQEGAGIPSHRGGSKNLWARLKTSTAHKASPAIFCLPITVPGFFFL